MSKDVKSTNMADTDAIVDVEQVHFYVWNISNQVKNKLISQSLREIALSVDEW